MGGAGRVGLWGGGLGGGEGGSGVTCEGGGGEVGDQCRMRTGYSNCCHGNHCIQYKRSSDGTVYR